MYVHTGTYGIIYVNEIRQVDSYWAGAGINRKMSITQSIHKIDTKKKIDMDVPQGVI